MLVQDLMTRAPVVVRTGTPLSAAAIRMRETAVGSIVVIDGEKPVGILTDRDVALALPEGFGGANVEDVMTPFPVSVPAEADIEMCLERMEEFRVRRILIMEGDVLVGVVSLDDILMHLSYLLNKASALIRYEVASPRLVL
jgi:CBS domain-containing protein